MIKRTSKKYIEKILAENKEWKVLDIGCGYSANKYASTICDVQDLSNFYKDKQFIKLDDKKLPFKNNEFDFVIASHVMEHVEDIDHFIKELERISKKGYIEVPTKLEDNLVFENEKDHLWHIEYDDIKLCLLISKKIQILKPILTVSTIQKMRRYFKNSLVIELYWENKIDYNFVKEINFQDNDLNLTTLLRKFISKKIRK